MVAKGYKKTEVGIIPEDWEVKELSEVLKFGSGKDYKHLGKGDIPVYGTGGVMCFVNDFLFEGESIGIGRKGTIDKPIFLSGKFWTVDTLFFTHSFNGIIPKLVYYKFLQIPWKEYNEASGVPSLNKNTLDGIKIPVPPTLKEQKAIAKVLTDTDNLIESLDKLIAKKKAIKKGAMQQLLTGKTRLKGFEGNGKYKQTELGLIPEDWDIDSLGNLLLDQPTYGIGAAAVDFKLSLPTYLRITDISDEGKLIYNSLKSVNAPNYRQYIIKENEIVIARTGASVGKSYLYDKKDGVLVYAGFLINFKPNMNRLDSVFLSQFLKTNFYWSWVGVNSMRSGQPGINSNEFKKLPISLPTTLKEQKAIATILSDMDKEIEALEAKNEKYQQLKQGMMQQLLTGKIRLV